MPRVVHFEICADQPDRALEFYTNVFGWQVQKAEVPGMDYWLLTTGPDDQPGINGAIMPRHNPAAHTTNYVDVDSVDEYTAKITAAGGTVIMAKIPIAGIGYAAYCMDSEGNPFGLFQDDPSAQ